MKIARVKCDKTNYMLPRGEHTGENLRAFFGVKPDHNLYIGCDGDDLLVEGDDPTFVDDGDRFYTCHRRIIGG